MAMNYVQRLAGAIAAGAQRFRIFPEAVPLAYDNSDDKLKFLDDDGTHVRKIVTEDQTQTLTGKTLTSPTITSPTISDPTITGVNSWQAKASSADFTADSGGTGSTLTNITGLTGISLAVGTYKFQIVVPVVTMTTNGGLKMAFKLTTTVLASINARVRQSTDTDNTGAVSTSFTTATDQATWFDQKAVAYTNAIIEGTMVVTTAGTIAVQAAQNTSHADTTTIPAGASAEFVRVA